MLDRAARFDADERVYRVALSPSKQDKFRRVRAELGLGPEFREALEFLNEGPTILEPGSLGELLHSPFRAPFRKGRYSDGSHGVLYTAREAETAGHEYAHWAPLIYGAHPGAPLTVRLSLFSCRFSGPAKDVRAFMAECPWLTSDDHAECQKLGAAALAEGLAGLVAPSARRPGGTTVPVFAEVAASLPASEGEVRFAIGAEVSFQIARAGNA